jgi:hypothetical protein
MIFVSWIYNLVIVGSSTPIADATVWATSDSAGLNTLASGLTDTYGNVTLSLDAGTVYLWTHKSGYNFTNPATKVISIGGSGSGTGTVATAGLVNAYCSLEDLKTIWHDTTSTNDQQYIDAINAASRLIDQYCMRQFYKTSGGTKYFATDRSDQVFIEDLLAITSLATDDAYDKSYSQAWTTADYWLEPVNGGVDGLPFTRITATFLNGLYFPNSNRWASSFRVKVIGDWGFSSSTPSVVSTACRIQASRYFDRKNIIFEQGGGMGATFKKLGTGIDPDVQTLLAQVKRYI